ncbi:hypothetical protein GXM_01699 [Nostoc sphaeroides CCNUC1]|uniref:Uncharacterized protein n=1 Tax=Nostoc sphaeroides CCNUC1 TaxID=2653204 RepID=A0A5P8VVR9_9NOSO|nr:hypothetical protein GXM_01699 [Nostoc sphaeroides CCNUC1]
MNRQRSTVNNSNGIFFLLGSPLQLSNLKFDYLQISILNFYGTKAQLCA